MDNKEVKSLAEDDVRACYDIIYKHAKQVDDEIYNKYGVHVYIKGYVDGKVQMPVKNDTAQGSATKERNSAEYVKWVNSAKRLLVEKILGALIFAICLIMFGITGEILITCVAVFVVKMVYNLICKAFMK